MRCGHRRRRRGGRSPGALPGGKRGHDLRSPRCTLRGSLLPRIADAGCTRRRHSHRGRPKPTAARPSPHDRDTGHPMEESGQLCRLGTCGARCDGVQPVAAGPAGPLPRAIGDSVPNECRMRANRCGDMDPRWAVGVRHAIAARASCNAPRRPGGPDRREGTCVSGCVRVSDRRDRASRRDRGPCRDRRAHPEHRGHPCRPDARRAS